ncbi:peptidase M19 [Rhodoferax saidenbachensis]|uniref:Peptidase M19 n=1 Tax=Rhodoferax saidenbachensis TaxID=1484693 RepID=A0A1P8K9U0_9BURK|nr:peptidase M19 [Rhodoferax saidenbachensis]
MLYWESHICLPLHPQASFAPLDRMRALGLNYVSINIGMDMNPLSQIMPIIASFRARLGAEPDKYRLVSSVQQIEDAKVAGVLAVGFDLEGAIPLMEQPAMVGLLSTLGVRQIHLAYNRNNSVADGCHDESRGLTPLGHRIVRAINEAGVIMDCSHTGRRCSLDIMAASTKPVVFSHANPQGMVDHGRNITDEQIRACAATGGVVGISGVSAFLGVDTPRAADIARHAAYVANLVGAQHVGIGMDNSFPEDHLDETPPGGMDMDYWWPKSAGYDRAIMTMNYVPVEDWAELPAALAAEGFGAEEVAGVMGGNMARVARETWGG